MTTKRATAKIAKQIPPPPPDPSEAGAWMAMLGRLSERPDVDVEKLERLIQLGERMQTHKARAEFYTAFAEMGDELPTVIERGIGHNAITYATNADIQDAVKPVLKRHGFMLSFRTAFADDGQCKITGVLAHRGGHSEQTEFVAKPDTSGSKNAIQAIGSTLQYGYRYTTRALLNIATRAEDDDGDAAGGRPDPPEGYEQWQQDFEAAAEKGMAPLLDVWQRGVEEFRHYAATYSPDWGKVLRAKASKVDAMRAQADAMRTQVPS